MPSLEAEAVVLRQYSLSEADCIVVFATRERGKLRAVARGARKPASRLGGALEPLNHVEVACFGKEGAELPRIGRCETIHSFLGRNPGLERIYGFTYFAELSLEFFQENNPAATLFRLLLAVLRAGERVGVGEALVRYFELWTLRLNGLLPDYAYCSDCGKYVKDEGFYVRLESEQGLCRTCAHERGMRVGPGAASLLLRMLELPPEQFASQPLPVPAGRDLERLARGLLEHNLERRLKSYPPLKEILSGG